MSDFISLMLDIKNMSSEDKLFNFISRLQPWAQSNYGRSCEELFYGNYSY